MQRLGDGEKLIRQKYDTSRNTKGLQSKRGLYLLERFFALSRNTLKKSKLCYMLNQSV